MNEAISRLRPKAGWSHSLLYEAPLLLCLWTACRQRSRHMPTLADIALLTLSHSYILRARKATPYRGRLLFFSERSQYHAAQRFKPRSRHFANPRAMHKSHEQMCWASQRALAGSGFLLILHLAYTDAETTQERAALKNPPSRNASGYIIYWCVQVQQTVSFCGDVVIPHRTAVL